MYGNIYADVFMYLMIGTLIIIAIIFVFSFFKSEAANKPNTIEQNDSVNDSKIDSYSSYSSDFDESQREREKYHTAWIVYNGETVQGCAKCGMVYWECSCD